MSEIVRTKRPATVTYGPRVAPLGEPAIMAHRTRAGLVQALKQRQQRGEFQSVHGDTLRYENGMYLVDVRLMPLPDLRPRPRWVRPARVAAAVLLPFAAVAGVGYWLASALSAAPAALLLILAVVGLLMATRRGRDVSILIQQNVDIK